jgi:hypothetical protein
MHGPMNMKFMYIYDGCYLAEFFLEWEMSQTKVTVKIETHVMLNNFFICRLWGNVEKCVTARQASYNSITRHMRVACKITKATVTHSECVILIAFTWQRWLREGAWRLNYTYIACRVI